ncbi:MAG: SH3 domain-containing protein [Treponema sp.]|nr:SH3 domain-containing protein [Treponema sp.]
MRRFLIFLAAFVSLIFMTALTGCSEKIMGYSVLLWNNPQENLASGQVLPVYIKSNISHVYIVGKEDGQKIEIPLWQMTEPVKKSKINQFAKKYQEHAATFASVKTDGLPCRAEAVNTSKQVYRLRKGEVIKILYKGTGQAPMTGGKPLEGDWYKILTEDGTQGWCFSYNLHLYEADINGKQIGGEVIVVEEEKDNRWEVIANGVWYPEEFKTLIESGNIDLTKLHPSYRFDLDLKGGKVTLNTSEIHQSWTFEGYAKTDDREYSLKNIPLKIIYRNAEYIVLRYTDESGKPQDLNFVTLSDNLTEIVNSERQRRSDSYKKIVARGPKFKASSYGTLTFNEDGTFHWTGYKLLVPTVISASAKTDGTAAIKYSLTKSLMSTYDGVVTFKFEGASEEVNFLYKLEDGALRLEDASTARFKGNQLIERGAEHIIIYFKK